MKNSIPFSFLSFLLLGVLLATAGCKKDDNSNSCTQSDWVGSYTGTVNCDGTTENVTVTITASGTDAIVIVYGTGNTTTTYDPLTPDGCKIDLTASAGGLTETVKATLDGDNFTLTEILSGGGQTTTCNLTATRM